LIVNEAAVRALGEMALLVETPSCLAVGWPARCLGREIRVLGRMQYRYASGLWDEWWVQFVDNQSSAWISQDEGEYMLEVPISSKWPVPNYDAVKPGDEVRFAKRKLWVEEKDRAEMVGMQGEVPLDAGPGRPMRYLDLTDNKVKATIEYFDDGNHLAFRGKYLGPRQLESDVDPQVVESGSAAYPPPPQLRPQSKKTKIVKSVDGLNPQTVSCTSCGGSVEIRDADGTVMVICRYCGSALDVTAPGGAQLLYESEQKKLPFPIEIGARGRLRGVDYVALGRLRYREADDSGVYVWDAMQLLSDEHGYAFLELENGHWMLFTDLRHPVSFNPRLATPKQKVHFQGQGYKVFETSAARVTYVEGELSWVARLGDVVHYMDAIRPPTLLSAEWTDTEMEWSLGTYCTPDEIVDAFQLPPEKRTRPQGVAPAQPFVRSRDQRISAWSGVAVACVLFFFALAGFLVRGEPVLRETTIPSNEYLSEAGYVSPEFEIPPGTHNCKLELSCRSVSNSWVAFSVAFLDDEENVVLDADATVEYYHGTEGGESWSEGSRSDYALFRLTGPKRYRLNIFGQAGKWSQSGGDQKATSAGSATLSLYRGVAPVRYFMMATFMAALFPMWEFGRQILFESQRWPSDDDDDDDDD
jgi:hypothetical protein